MIEFHELKLELPFPPSVNNYKTVGRIIKTSGGKLYQQRNNSIETKMFYWEVYSIAKKIRPAEGFKFARSAEIALWVTVVMHPSIQTAQRRWDLDNRLKVLLDSLTRAKVICDDSQIHRLHVEKGNVVEEGKVIIKIAELVSGEDAIGT